LDVPEVKYGGDDLDDDQFPPRVPAITVAGSGSGIMILFLT